MWGGAPGNPYPYGTPEYRDFEQQYYRQQESLQLQREHNQLLQQQINMRLDAQPPVTFDVGPRQPFFTLKTLYSLAIFAVLMWAFYAFVLPALREHVFAPLWRSVFG